MKLSTILSICSCLLAAPVFAKKNTATLHIHKGRGNKAIIISRGKVPDVGLFEKSDPSVLGEGSDTLIIKEESFSTTGGGLAGLSETADVFLFPLEDVTVDWDACSGLDLALEVKNKKSLPLPFLGVIGDGSSPYLVLPVNATAGDAASGRAEVENLDETDLGKILDDLPAYTTCSFEWKNEDGDTQRIEIVFGKDLTVVYIIVGAILGFLLLLGVGALFFICTRKNSEKK